MSLTERANKSTILSQQEKLILGILSNQDMTVEELMGCLMSEPYELTFYEVFNGMNDLRDKRLLELSRFSRNHNGSVMQAHITFAHDWVFKL